MSEDFEKNAIPSYSKISRESIVNMTKSFNLDDFYGEKFRGMAEIMITPHQVIIMYGDSGMFHNYLIEIIADVLRDSEIRNPIISIRCRSEKKKKFFYSELLKNSFCTEDMITVLETLYNQLDEISNRNGFDVIGQTLQEFKDVNIIPTIVEKISDIPKGGNDKEIIGIPIRDYINLTKERDNDFER